MFNLTKQERVVLISLGFIFLFGSMLHCFFRNHAVSEIFRIVDSDKIYPKVDLNRAKIEDLVRLPGIGPALAKSIIKYREQHGPFTAIEELRLVEGVHSRNYSKLIKYLKLAKRGP